MIVVDIYWLFKTHCLWLFIAMRMPAILLVPCLLVTYWLKLSCQSLSLSQAIIRPWVWNRRRQSCQVSECQLRVTGPFSIILYPLSPTRCPIATERPKPPTQFNAVRYNDFEHLNAHVSAMYVTKSCCFSNKYIELYWGDNNWKPAGDQVDGSNDHLCSKADCFSEPPKTYLFSRSFPS